MKDTHIFTTSNSFWHFHPIGVGIIFNYHINSMQIVTTCEHTGIVIDTQSYHRTGGLTKEQFKQIAYSSYKKFIENGSTINLEYMNDPTIVGCIGVDFDLIKN